MINLAPVCRFLSENWAKDEAVELLHVFGKHHGNNLEFVMHISDIFKAMAMPEESIQYGEIVLNNIQNENDREMIELRLLSSYRQANFSQKALKIVDRLYAKTNDVGVLLEKAGLLYEDNQKDQARKLLESINVSSLNEYQLAKRNTYYAPYLLKDHKFKQGMEAVIFESNKLRKLESGQDIFHNKKELPLDFWYGTNDCKKLIIFAEAGLGDEIINIRFMNKLREKGIQCKWYGHWHKNPVGNKRVGAAEWFQKCGYDVLIDFDPEKYKDWMWTYSQYLPLLLGVEENELWTGPYMTAGKKRLSKKKKNVGLRWAGNFYPLHRNFTLTDLYEPLKDLDVNFYSLQTHADMDELKKYPEIIDLSSKLDDIKDTAAYINSFDLTITCCTCTCPIAGALDKENITIVPISEYYIFNCDSIYTPWYSNKMTLVRQQTPRKWSDIMPQVRQITIEKLGL